MSQSKFTLGVKIENNITSFANLHHIAALLSGSQKKTGCTVGLNSAFNLVYCCFIMFSSFF